MKAILAGVIIFGLSQAINAQQLDWKQLIVKELEVKEDVSSDGVYLVEGSREQITSDQHAIKILRSLDANHHIVSGNIENLDRAFTVTNDWKLDEDQRGSKTAYYIVLEDGFEEELSKIGPVLQSFPSSNTYLIKGDLSIEKQKLLDISEVLYLTNKVSRPETESRVIDMNLNPNRVNKIHHYHPTLNGITERVSIQEDRYDKDDIDLQQRNTYSGLESNVVDNHATEMATIIGGAGNSFVTGRGVAKRVKMTSSSFDQPMPDDDQDYLDLGINTQNHSYGTALQNEYGIESRAFDVSAFNNKNLIHVFSSGNLGEEVSPSGTYADVEGFANLTGTIKMAKNTLVVGSVDTIGATPAFVSRGPAYDGRLKPEVVAYSNVGSSNSAALVSGIAVLLQQHYRETNGMDMPSALVKALIVNGAVDVGNPGPDFVTGYGNVDAWRSLEMLTNGQYAMGSVSNGAVESIALAIPSNAINLKVVLCWTDPAANVGDFKALVNDLDLRLINGAMMEILPWVLDSRPSKLALQASRKVDTLNNTEQVTIGNPETDYTIEVEGASVDGTQEFFIAWQYDIEDAFEWDFPTGSDNMPYNGETGSYFRWTTTKTGVGELEYSLNETDWVLLDDQVNLENGYWRWQDPPLLNDEVKARIRIGMDVFETDFFSVSEPLDTRVGFSCADSVMLRWEAIPGATDYTVFNMGNKLLEEIVTVSDTSLIIENNAVLDRRFSIRPNLPSGNSLIQTPTFDYTLQGIDCYIYTFFQTVALDTGIYLNLDLGTIYGIEEVVFERFDSQTSSEIAVIDHSELTEQIRILDDRPNQGYNEHIVTLRFQNGETQTLSAGITYFLSESPVRVFPNPVEAGGFVSVLTKNFDGQPLLFELLDAKGAVVKQVNISNLLDSVEVSGLISGIYYYRLWVGDEGYSGRILIR